MTIVRLYAPLFTVTLLLSAFLLFSVEPMAGKMILPMLGGAPAVWNTAMVFFQAMLLAGYGYAHLTSKFLKVRQQAALHGLLMLGCIAMLPVAVPAGWPAPDIDHPVRWQLYLMTVMAGAPFFLLAAGAPMLQHWFARSGHPRAGNPYFLYAASNAGSLAALLAYSTAIEPAFSIGEQSRLWSLGFIALLVLTACSGLLAGRQEKNTASNSVPLEPLSNGVRLRWLGLAALPSSLMLGVTTFISTDIAAVPLLWIIPLALYVLTFIIAFSGQTIVSAKIASAMQALLLLFLVYLMLLHMFTTAFLIIPLHLALFFFAALLCHSELALIKPGPGRLTEFYMIVSLGGVLGGLFNALAAPMLFVLPVEYAIALGLVSFARDMHRPDQRFTLKYAGDSLMLWFLPLSAVAAAALTALRYTGYYSQVPQIGAAVAVLAMLGMMRNRLAFALGAMILLAFNPCFSWAALYNMLSMERNFFGVAKVQDSASGNMRLFLEGTTIHGAQPLIAPYRLVPMGYYHPQGPAGNIFGILDRRGGPQKIAALGLGVGSIACYTRPGRMFDFYEIDPAVLKVATNPRLFTYLSQCGSPYRIVMGDGRLKIREAADHSYDLIFLDAFSSDNIPIHLLTTDAFTLYRQKLKPHGMIAADISNRYMELKPVMQAAADRLGMKVYFKTSPHIDVVPPDVYAYPTEYALFLENEEDAAPFVKAQWSPYEGRRIRAWTDDYANPLSAMVFIRAKLPRN